MVPRDAHFEICVDLDHEGHDPCDHSFVPKVRSATLAWTDHPGAPKTDVTDLFREVKDLAPRATVAVHSNGPGAKNTDVQKFLQLGKRLQNMGGVELLRQVTNVCVAECLRGKVESMWTSW